MSLELYDKLRVVPEEAKKTIQGGRISGMTDINPMWRIKVMTDTFGICGVGWYYEVTKQWVEKGGNDEIAAFVNVDLYIKVEGEWSKPIPGNGGSMFVAKEKYGLYTSDECWKMATTDALSVAFKQLGVGADVYFEKDRTKYSPRTGETTEKGKVAAVEPDGKRLEEGIAKMNACQTMAEVTACWKEYKDLNKDAGFIDACKKIQLNLKGA